MTATSFIVYVVDDDAQVLKALERLLQNKGFQCRLFQSPSAFLDHYEPSVNGCAVLDLHMRGIDGIELQQILAKKTAHLPIIFLTGKGDIRTSVRAMRAGAVDFLTKPVSANDLFAALHRARDKADRDRRTSTEHDAIKRRLAQLTRRQREVLEHVLAGRRNKDIAQDLGIVESTTKLHRKRVMQKMGVRSVADLVRLAGRVGVQPYSSAIPCYLFSGRRYLFSSDEAN